MSKIIKDEIQNAVNNQGEPKIIYNMNVKMIIEVLSKILGDVFADKIFKIDERKQPDAIGGNKFEWCLRAKCFHQPSLASYHQPGMSSQSDLKNFELKHFYPLITKESIQAQSQRMPDDIFARIE